MEPMRLEQMFLEAIRQIIGDDRAAHFAADVGDFSALMTLAGAQKLLPVVIEAVHELPTAKEWPEFASYKRAAQVQVMQQTKRTAEFLVVYEKLREAGIRALVVKGSVCRSVWPKGDLRLSADEDLYIRPEEFEKACAVLRECGLACSEKADLDKDFEIGWRRPSSTLYIELHQKLFAPDSEAVCDLQMFFDGAFARATEYSVDHGQAKVWSLSPEDHLLYLILHAYKHFIHSGFGIRQVCDIGLWAKHYGKEVNHNSFIRNLTKAHALHFAAAVFAIAKEDLGIEPQLPESLTELPIDRKPMLRDLLDAGVYGSSSRSRLHSAPMTVEAVAASRRDRKKRSLIHRAFPSRRELLADYPELEVHSLRLPLVWAKRLAKYRSETKNIADNSLSGSIRISNEREALLRRYKII